MRDTFMWILVSEWKQPSTLHAGEEREDGEVDDRHPALPIIRNIPYFP